MGINTVTKKVVLTELLKEVTGNSAAEAGAKGSFASEKAKNIMASMGVNLPEIDHLYSIGQLKVEPFKIEFVVQKVIDKPQELTMPETEEFSGLARVIDDSKNLTLEFKPFVGGSLSNETFDLIFLEKEIFTNLPGTDKTIKALSAGVKGKFYHIQIPGEIFELYNEDDNESGNVGGDTEEQKPNLGGNLKKESDEIEKIKQEIDQLKSGYGSDTNVKGDKVSWTPEDVKNSEQLRNKIGYDIKNLERKLKDLRKKEPGTQLSMFDQYHNLKNILKENLTLLLEIDDNQTKIKFPVTMEIYLSDIELGSKGKAKKRGDVSASYGKGGGKFDGNHVSMQKNVSYPISGKITTSGGIPNDVKNFVNVSLESQNGKITRSEQNKNTIILSINDTEYLVVTSNDKNPNWFKTNLPVKIGRKPLGHSNITTSDAILNIKPRK